MSRSLAALALPAWLALAAGPAGATTVPLTDQTPGTRCLALGLSDLTFHGALDWALDGRARGWTVGLVGGFDHADPLRRDSHTMVALRTTRALWTLWPFTVSGMLSAGVNVVDSDAPVPSRTVQRFTMDWLPWVQPAVLVSVRPAEQVWVRASFGPVFGRWTAGRYAMPWLVPNMELAYRVFHNQELVLAGGYGSPYGLGWRAAF